MAPIDCSGVSRAAGLKWFCKICSVVHRDKVGAGDNGEACAHELKAFDFHHEILLAWGILLFPSVMVFCYEP